MAQVDCVTLANNHSLDYGVDALLDCLQRLDQAHIKHAGAGHNLHTAQALAWLETVEGRIAVIALTDDIRLWAATADRPGLHEVQQRRVCQIRLHPVIIQDLRVRQANGEVARFLQERMRQRSAELGSVVDIQDSLAILCLVSDRRYALGSPGP